MDELGSRNVNDFGGPEIWRRAIRSLPTLLDASQDRREPILKRMFGDGTALSWLTSIFRQEIFAHGRHGNRPNSDRLLSESELDTVTALLLPRYQHMTFEDFAAQLNPLSMLFAWQQGGDEDGPRKLLAEEIETEEGLISVLERLTGRVLVGTTTGEREVVTLSRNNIQSLIDYGRARERIELLSENSNDEALKARARWLRRNFQDGDYF